MALYKGSEPVAGLAKNIISNAHFLFEPIWSDHIINDIQFLRADTFSWQSGDVYVTAYNKLVEEYSTGTTETESSITFKRTTNGFKIADTTQEQAILNKYNTDGIAWFYILDTTNKKFKLPRTKWGFKGLRTDVGNSISESLPNIKANWGAWGAGYNGTGAITTIEATGDGGPYVSSGGYRSVYDFNASRSSLTYQDNAPVQERGTQMYLYFYVGEYAREAIEQTAGITSEQLNSKIDIASLSEINPMIISYINGTSGYNIWANGYCEQWGRCALNEIQTTTVTLMKNFRDTYFNVQAVSITESVAQDTEVGLQCTPYSTNSIRVSAHYINPNSQTACWKVCGYLAEGEY